ncbi:Fasciclin-domain-containing protein [Wilcoxina mikolae CBS 423.85]|nr:Fasciclin-domain-containing protein [Wilcoxina mikolae CBS 423.85]
MNPISFVPLFLCISAVLSQSPPLMAATENRPDLSMFRQLMINNPVPARTLLSNTQVPPEQQRTLMIPSNDAFLKYEQRFGQPVQGAPEAILSALFNYHTLNGAFTDQQLNQPGGMTAPSGLLDDTYNHRIPVNQLPQPNDGQVVLITQVAGLGHFQARANNPLYAQSGLGDQISMDQASSSWSGGLFRVVDGYATKLTRLLGSLDHTNLTGTLDNLRNVTCLAPYDIAFAIGDPDKTLPMDTLKGALLYHTLPGAAYTTTLKDGEIIKSAQGGMVLVTKKENGDIYFNDAKVIAQNVITNNGVIHVLDKIMSPLNATIPPAPTNTTPIPSAVPTFTESSSTTIYHGMNIAASFLMIPWAALY